MKNDTEQLESRIAELIDERDAYDNRRRESIKKLEEYRAEVLQWRQWRKQILSQFDGVFGSRYSIRVETTWEELCKDCPFPEGE